MKLKFVAGLLFILTTLFVGSTSAKGYPSDAGPASVSVCHFMAPATACDVAIEAVVTVSFEALSFSLPAENFTSVTVKEVFSPPDGFSTNTGDKAILFSYLKDIEAPLKYCLRSPLTGKVKNYYRDVSTPDLKTGFSCQIHSPPKIMQDRV